MGYKVRVVYDTGMRRDYGTGKEGTGGSYQTKATAEKRAVKLARRFTAKKGFSVKVIRSTD